MSSSVYTHDSFMGHHTNSRPEPIRRRETRTARPQGERVSLPFYQMYPKDFDADENVRCMTLAGLGLYLLCLNHSWVNDGLPQDPERVRRSLRCEADVFASLWLEVEPMFPISEDGRRRNSRQEIERKRAEKISKTNVKRGKKGASARWSTDALSMRHACSTHAQTIARASGSDSISVSGSSSCFSEEEKTANGFAEKPQRDVAEMAGASPGPPADEPPLAPEQPPRGPRLDFEAFLARWKNHPGFKKPNKALQIRASGKFSTLDLDENGLALALDGYHASDWGRREDWPIMGFLKFAESWACEKPPDEERALSWDHDAGYVEAAAAYAAIAPTTEADKRKGYPYWGKLSANQRRDAEAGFVRVDPAWPKLWQNYLRDEEWTRPPKRASPEARDNEVLRILREGV